MAKRIFVGILIALVVCGAIATRFWETIVFDIFVFLLSLCCAFEIVKENVKEKRRFFLVPILGFPVLIFMAYFFASSVAWAFLYQVVAVLIVFASCLFAEIMLPKTKIGKKELEENPTIYEPGHLFECSIRTIAYCVYPSMFLGTLYGINALGLEMGLVGLLLVFGISAASDTFAFFFGVWLKGTRLCPEISPKKGVPGMIFGFIGGLIASCLIFVFFRFSGVISNPIENINFAWGFVLFCLLGLIGSFLTQMGDLFESALKRNLKIKDFGNIFPGHGGFMDRVDGQMFNSVFVLIMLLICF